MSCRYTGLYGRTGVFEMLDVGRRIRTLINEGKDANEIHHAGRIEGMEPLRDAAVRKLADGVHDVRRNRSHHGGFGMSTACAEELQLLIRSGWSLIALESSEEDRALGLLRRIAQATERRCITWTLASGLDAREIDSPLKEPQDQALLTVPAPAP